jgi:tetratricopeptide (TPR) repeat protein
MILTDDALGRALFDAGDYEAALIEADSDPDLVKGALRKSAIYFEQIRYADALAALRTIPDLEKSPPRLKARVYGQRAAIYVKMGKRDGPLIDYEAARYWAIEAGDELCEASVRNNLARVYSKDGRFEEALIEVDAAIRTAESLGECFWLGRFLDQKAQIFLDHKRYSDAVSTSRKAVELLELHGNKTTLSEAMITQGKAWIALGASSLNKATAFRVQRETVSELNPSLDKELIQLTLKNCEGHVSRAAEILGISHVAMIKAIRKHGLERHPERRRAKALASPRK